ncbi:beta-lactamase family protein, partial [Tothia fuscella]
SDVLGPRFPPTTGIGSKESIVADAWKNVSAVFDSYLTGDRSKSPELLTGLENLTFSLGLWSLHDPSALSLQYHYTSKEVKDGPGVDKVDADSIYRVASLSKLFTVFAGLLSFEHGEWDRPITDFISGLTKDSLNRSSTNPIRSVQWEDVTLKALAAQIAGVPRAAHPVFADLAVVLPDPTALGLPPLEPTDPAIYWPCLANLELLLDPTLTIDDICTPELYLAGQTGSPPAFQPFTSPVYSNNGFVLLGMALANITGKPLGEIYPDLIFGPLGMNNSRTIAPTNKEEWSQYVIPGTEGIQEWARPGGSTISSGGLFSSLNDLAKFGIAIMNSTLLPPAITREWMKPISFSASLDFALGAPWEIYRYVHEESGAVTDIYTKVGDSGNFTGFACLIPDYDVGFNVIASMGTNNTLKSVLTWSLADIITTNILPALEAQAALEASTKYAGTYKSSNPALNSSITISYAAPPRVGVPGLYLESFISNGTNAYLTLFGGAIRKLQPSIREKGEIAMRTVKAGPFDKSLGPFLKMFNENGDWLVVDAQTYGGVGTDLFVFELGEDGRAKSVEFPAARVKLGRVE